jgi:hypothetical protein
VIVQAFILHRYCLLCDLTHACGLVSLLVLLVYRPADVPRAYRNGAGAVAMAGTLLLVLGHLLFRPQIAPTQIVVAPSTQPLAGSVLSTQSAAGSQPNAASSAPSYAVIPAVRPANAFDLTDAAGTAFATNETSRWICAASTSTQPSADPYSAGSLARSRVTVAPGAAASMAAPVVPTTKSPRLSLRRRRREIALRSISYQKGPNLA